MPILYDQMTNGEIHIYVWHVANVAGLINLIRKSRDTFMAFDYPPKPKSLLLKKAIPISSLAFNKSLARNMFRLDGFEMYIIKLETPFIPAPVLLMTL